MGSLRNRHSISTPLHHIIVEYLYVHRLTIHIQQEVELKQKSRKITGMTLKMHGGSQHHMQSVVVQGNIPGALSSDNIASETRI
jgi:hypothetical protein